MYVRVKRPHIAYCARLRDRFISVRWGNPKAETMPEQYRRPSWHEANERVERMRLAREAEQDALLVVRYFNARLSGKRSAGFWPTIGTALNSKHAWLVAACDSCGTVVDMDLRVKPRDPEASIRVALRDVRCPRCNGHGRLRIIGLSSRPSS